MNFDINHKIFIITFYISEILQDFQEIVETRLINVIFLENMIVNILKKTLKI